MEKSFGTSQAVLRNINARSTIDGYLSLMWLVKTATATANNADMMPLSYPQWDVFPWEYEFPFPLDLNPLKNTYPAGVLGTPYLEVMVSDWDNNTNTHTLTLYFESGQQQTLTFTRNNRYRESYASAPYFTYAITNVVVLEAGPAAPIDLYSDRLVALSYNQTTEGSWLITFRVGYKMWMGHVGTLARNLFSAPVDGEIVFPEPPTLYYNFKPIGTISTTSILNVTTQLREI